MKNILNIMMKDLKIYFVSPIAYTILTMFLLISGYFFVLILFHSQECSMNYVFGNMTFTLLFIIPILTMRLFSEEKKTGTIEILMTSSIKEFELVMGKLLACFILFMVMILLTFLYPIWLLIIGEPDKGPLITGYIGILFLGLSFISVGIFCSSLTKNQIVSAILSFGILLFIWILGWVADESKSQITKNVFQYICLLEHFDDFQKGVIDTKDVVYYLTFSGFFVYLTTKTVELKKWR
ncbi:MAG: ABC transporter permease [bacterium]